MGVYGKCPIGTQRQGTVADRFGRVPLSSSHPKVGSTSLARTPLVVVVVNCLSRSNGIGIGRRGDRHFRIDMNRDRGRGRCRRAVAGGIGERIGADKAAGRRISKRTVRTQAQCSVADVFDRALPLMLFLTSCPYHWQGHYLPSSSSRFSQR